ncbi:hypothetical protein R6Q59_006833 [Mikania micrantha]
MQRGRHGWLVRIADEVVDVGSTCGNIGGVGSACGNGKEMTIKMSNSSCATSEKETNDYAVLCCAVLHMIWRKTVANQVASSEDTVGDTTLKLHHLQAYITNPHNHNHNHNLKTTNPTITIKSSPNSTISFRPPMTKQIRRKSHTPSPPSSSTRPENQPLMKSTTTFCTNLSSGYVN